MGEGLLAGGRFKRAFGLPEPEVLAPLRRQGELRAERAHRASGERSSARASGKSRKLVKGFEPLIFDLENRGFIRIKLNELG